MGIFTRAHHPVHSSATHRDLLGQEWQQAVSIKAVEWADRSAMQCPDQRARRLIGHFELTSEEMTHYDDDDDDNLKQTTLICYMAT
ncbi:hypothetical protein ElyMa_003313400 [Elysia marginata]|uniref:Uncharacterized protein n=1 Tax=Elysia marginata TaxID=1093978 RepID=A0AAV4JEZ2_9GAST|nr:hypothetical protein ElyMa_003313400 [Elysia marginata]